MRKVKRKKRVKNPFNWKENKDIKTLLKKTKKINPDIENIALTSIEGLSIASNFSLKFKLKFRVPKGVISAMSAAICSVGARAIEEITSGELKKMIVEGDKGKIIITPSGRNALLTVFTSIDKNPAQYNQGKLIAKSSLDARKGKIFMQEFKEKQKLIFAMAGAIISVGERSIYYMRKSLLKRVVIESNKGNVIVSLNKDKTLIKTLVQNIP